GEMLWRLQSAPSCTALLGRVYHALCSHERQSLGGTRLPLCLSRWLETGGGAGSLWRQSCRFDLCRSGLQRRRRYRVPPPIGLRCGADRVYAVDTGYGTLAWKLRQDPRVVVLERTNAAYFDPATLADFAGCDLVAVDLGWTRQRLAIPAALRWLHKPDASNTL